MYLVLGISCTEDKSEWVSEKEFEVLMPEKFWVSSVGASLLPEWSEKAVARDNTNKGRDNICHKKNTNNYQTSTERQKYLVIGLAETWILSHY